ncbi:kinase activator [Coccidioides immitis RS]|uniref:Autophagy-related protein 17 n=4 Tax=Coccidioides posadasii TaxID=199306 RepID=E9D896_COCPS|nr:kinase activator [Coccidioides immitis RS]XP_003067567.1 hypothetical protein CPC735_065220 [Coccidioides posadasii C735 delta SOWgp]EFW17604.1 kinase activator [Coccidioides posadasii str. Silveira]KMM70754.1 hypothetical protein CPAG_07065 [Coccidioides posadasii RMSCC 3488]EAS34245.3 kinase activator [Coccidioides immitis RS]EER25422.1 hypothetical protein CPC735_065220 [Coccidioides posadasii C735 delta SOWgp]|eukprot:XP_003067567.1 hypothetical protein CPC735_065220 [Coccidioides posadasii C735 delta SOWgp]
MSSSSMSSSGVDGQFRAASVGDEDQQPNLETLVAHLVAAKRSLSSINHVWRANEIVTAARAALEESVVLSARTGFLHRELEVQLRVLYQIKDEIGQVAHYGREEFSSTLKQLDDVDEKLQQALNVLRETPVEASFLPAGEEPKTLHDFVDEKAVQDLQTVLKDAIDNTNSAQADLDSSNNAFDEDLDSIQRKMSRYRVSTNLLSSSSKLSSSAQPRANIPSPAIIPELLHSLESHAQEMADLLESLVHHFDLCATAVKHTEGGGAAALRITGELPSGLAVGVRLGEGEDQDSPNAPPEPLTESEYQEMLSVIVKDATEAEDVVLEIQDRITEMENILVQIFTERDLLAQSCAGAVDSVQHLDHFFKNKLSSYISQSQVFTSVWKEQRGRMQAGMTDLSDLRTMYVGFLDAYDDLILEVARRKSVRLAVERVLHEARVKLDKLYEDDVRHREAFRVEQGDFLPSDIWPGLGRAPMRVEFKRIFDSKSDIETGAPKEMLTSDGECAQSYSEGPKRTSSTRVEDSQHQREPERTEPGSDSIPDLPKYLIERALVRRKAKIKANRLPATQQVK